MIEAVDHVVLLWIWDFLGAVFIRSDMYIALQSHAVERQFNNWAFHVLINEQARRVFETIESFSIEAHPEISQRLQNAFDLLVLRCVNKDLRERCSDLLEAKEVVLHEFVCVSRPVLWPWKIISEIRHKLNDVRRREERQGSLDDLLDGRNKHDEDYQRERICKLRLLETSLVRLIRSGSKIMLLHFVQWRNFQSDVMRRAVVQRVLEIVN